MRYSVVTFTISVGEEEVWAGVGASQTSLMWHIVHSISEAVAARYTNHSGVALLPHAYPASGETGRGHLYEIPSPRSSNIEVPLLA